MNASLERLNELVRQAEAKSRAKKLGSETQQAAEQLRTAEQRARVAAKRLREVRPARLRELEQAESEEQQLRELTKKLAQFKSSLDPDTQAEALIDGARAEIDRVRREATTALEEVNKESDEARKGLRAAMETYLQLRKELDRLQPQLADSFSQDDKLLSEVETYFPGGQLQSLAREVEAAGPYFGVLSRPEQYAQLKIWIGRHRQFQAAGERESDASTAGGDEIPVLAQRVFHQLKGLSKQYEPGYIEAFRLDFHTDWNAYIAEAQEQLLQATEQARSSREREQMRGEYQAREVERQQQARESGRAAVVELKALMARASLPDEGLDEFLGVLKQAVNGLGASDPDLLELVMPYRELISGGNGLRALRRNLDRIRQDETAREDISQTQFQDLLEFTQGRRALMIGGSVREDVRKTLQRVFNFDRLDWEPYEDAKPAVLDSLEQRVRNHGVDVVLILRSFIGHHVTDRLRPLCQQNGIPCLLVEHGYGPAQIGETLRRGLIRSA
jgi:hypothetical protein